MEKLIFFLFPFFALSEVGPDFNNCLSFFLDGKPPLFTPPNGVFVEHICQCLLDQNNKINYYYATLYSKTWRIPVYSAYVFGIPNVRRIDRWYIEPMLDVPFSPCMAPKGKNQIGQNQALNEDYSLGYNFNRGHLYPVLHTNTVESMLATSTLTNAAPQDPNFNQIVWLANERAVLNDLKPCSKAFVVTGVVPDTDPKKKMNGRVNVAKYYWSAYACKSNNVWIKRGFYGPDNNGNVQNVTIPKLEADLSSFYGSISTITIFP